MLSQESLARCVQPCIFLVSISEIQVKHAHTKEWTGSNVSHKVNAVFRLLWDINTFWACVRPFAPVCKLCCQCPEAFQGINILLATVLLLCTCLQIDVCHCSDFVRRFPNAFCQCSLPAIVGSLTFACSPICFLALPCYLALFACLAALPFADRPAHSPDCAIQPPKHQKHSKQVQKCLFPLLIRTLPAFWMTLIVQRPCVASLISKEDTLDFWMLLASTQKFPDPDSGPPKPTQGWNISVMPFFIVQQFAYSCTILLPRQSVKSGQRALDWDAMRWLIKAMVGAWKRHG